MNAVEKCEEIRKRVAGYHALSTLSKNRGQRKRFEKQAVRAYEELQRHVRVNRLPRELAP